MTIKFLTLLTLAILSCSDFLLSNSFSCSLKTNSLGFDISVFITIEIISFFNYINRVADGLGLEPEEFIDSKGYKK